MCASGLSGGVAGVGGADEVDQAGEILAGEFQFEAFGHEADSGGLQFGDIAAVEGILLVAAAAESDCSVCFFDEDTGRGLTGVVDGDELQEVGADFAVGIEDVCEQFGGSAVAYGEQAGSDIGTECSESMAAAAFALEHGPALLCVWYQAEGILPCGNDIGAGCGAAGAEQLFGEGAEFGVGVFEQE